MTKHIRILSAVLVLVLLLCACSKSTPTLESDAPTPTQVANTNTPAPDTNTTSQSQDASDITPTPEPTNIPTDTPIPLATLTATPQPTITPTPQPTITPTPTPTISIPTRAINTVFEIVTPAPTAEYTANDFITKFQLDDNALERANPSSILATSDFESLGAESSTKINGYIKNATTEKIEVDKILLKPIKTLKKGFNIINSQQNTATYPIHPNCEVWFLATSSLQYKVPTSDLPDFIENYGDEVIWDIYLEDDKVVMIIERPPV